MEWAEMISENCLTYKLEIPTMTLENDQHRQRTGILFSFYSVFSMPDRHGAMLLTYIYVLFPKAKIVNVYENALNRLQ